MICAQIVHKRDVDVSWRIKRNRNEGPSNGKRGLAGQFCNNFFPSIHSNYYPNPQRRMGLSICLYTYRQVSGCIRLMGQVY